MERNYQRGKKNIFYFLCWAADKKWGWQRNARLEAKENNLRGLQDRSSLTGVPAYFFCVCGFFFFREHLNRLSKPFCPWQRDKALSMRCIEDGWRAAESWRKLGVGVESVLCRLSGSRLTTVAEWQGVQIVNSSRGTKKINRCPRLSPLYFSWTKAIPWRDVQDIHIFIGISYGGGQGNPARPNESEADLSCSIKCAVSDISLTDALLSPLHYGIFLLRWGTVCKSPRCNIMVCKDSTCATLHSDQTLSLSSLFFQLRWRKTQQKNSHKRILDVSSFHPKYTHRPQV